MTKLSQNIQMLKLQKSLKLSVKCGTTPINPSKIDLKSNIKRTKKLLLKIKLTIFPNMAKLKRRRKEKTIRKNDS
jgi:hypothetical protein